MKPKNTIDTVKQRYEERKKYYLDQFFQDEELIGNAISEVVFEKYAIDFFRGMWIDADPTAPWDWRRDCWQAGKCR